MKPETLRAVADETDTMARAFAIGPGFRVGKMTLGNDLAFSPHRF
ncbi:MAG: hypothetical protein N2255_07210 [Kiritimatiellae bacterium]|nr:hypothetical protein [Kiritimatiellia bacterium]